MTTAKKQRTDGGDDTSASKTIQHIQELDAIQSTIEEYNAEASAKLIELEQQYNAKKRPHFEKRNAVIAKIPDFWLQVFSNHIFVGQLLTLDDQEVFKALEVVDVEDFKDVTSGFKVTMRFRDNPFFTNKELVKEFKYSEDGDLTVTSTTIKWKPGKNLVEKTEESSGGGEGSSGGRKGGKGGKTGNKRGRVYLESFFNWFAPEDQELELGEIIKDDIFPNPLRLYMGMDEDTLGFASEGEDDSASGSDDASEDLGGQDV